MLEQLGNSGLYVMEEPVCGFPPREVLPSRLDVRQLFERTDEARDELVRRLLEFCYKKDQWVGVSWTALMNGLDNELESYQRIVHRTRPGELAYQEATKKHIRSNFWTLGLYGYFRPAPLPPVNLERAALEKKILWSSHDQREQLGLAAMRLVAEEYLKVDVDLLGHDRLKRVFFLTANLVWLYVRKEKA
ncbi:MAG: hypothetical protein WDN47_01490 [Candidatus Doudnabacteria bacterium]